MAGKDGFENEFHEGIYVDIRNGEVYSFKKEEGANGFGRAWLGSPLETKSKRGVLLSDGDALMENFAPVSLRENYIKDFLDMLED